MILKFRHLFLIAVLISPTTVSAIIMRHDVSEARYRNLGERFRPLVVQMGITRETGGAPILWNGMGTLIHPRWVLTAAHVANYIPGAPGGPRPSARHYVFVQGRGYLVDKIIFPDLTIENGGKAYVQNDIALVRLAEPVQTGTFACLHKSDDEKGKRVIIAGMGKKGDGRRGVTGADGSLRGAEQVINGVTDGSDRNVMWYTFDSPTSKRALRLEGAAGPGDSGGPAFVSEQGRTCVIGVGSGQDHRGRNEGQYGVKEFYTRVSRFAPWIEQTIGQDL